MSSNIAIRVSNLGKCYNIYDKPQDRLKQTLWRGRKQFFREFWALRDVSFEVRKGETVGIIGRNGSGKSTLLQLIVGTLTPSFGEVAVNGRVAALLELGSGFNPDFTGRENIFMNAVILGLNEAEINARFDEIAAFADIGDFIEHPVKTYSSGMIMRLAFAVSVCVSPDILIIDEALGVGDLAFQIKCSERLEKLTQSGVTLLFVSHDIGTVKAFCQTAIYLKEGVMSGMQGAADIVEMYLMDMRDEQKLNARNSVVLKPSRGAHIAFGTIQGSVVSAWFEDTRTTESAYMTGDAITIRVQVEHDQTIRVPTVSILIQDHRMIEIAGRFHKIEHPERGASTVSFTLPASFNAGRYYVTVRLEDRLSEQRIMPVDKQVGMLNFTVNRPSNLSFIGMVNLPIESIETDPAQ